MKITVQTHITWMESEGKKLQKGKQRMTYIACGKTLLTLHCIV